MTKDRKVEVQIVGPCCHRFGNESWQNDREYVVTVDCDYQGEFAQVQFRMATSDYSGDGKWSTPYIEGPRVPGNQFGLDLVDLEKRTAYLRKLVNFAKRLPIQPHTIDQWVATTLAMERVKTITSFVIFPDHFNRATYTQDETVKHVLYEIERRSTELVPQPKVAVA